ncbi:MAG: F-type H+-transporting ATPase subunit delta [Clostridia bacterium]|nr:F-type H+-transporting ATPase subunit delta [Clostridia bacterium]MDN5376051.1 F-type H+-transporting ATPase subunit delta [Thermacetogenium sp.]
MIEKAVARRYARGLFDVAREQNQVEAVASDLQEVVAALGQNPELRKLLERQWVATKDKKELLKKLWQERVCRLVYSFLELLIDKHRERYLEAIAEVYLDLVRDLKNIIVAEIRTAFPLDPQREAALKQALEKMTRKNVELRMSVDSGLIGGLVIKVGDRVYDGSVKKRLQMLGARFVERPLGKLEVGM